MEIERKFLPSDHEVILAQIQNLHGKPFSQGYLNTDPVIRIRKEEDAYVLTYKGNGMMRREEYNLPINRTTFLHLLPKCDHYILSKTRYYLPLDKGEDWKENLIAEIDVFHGRLDGLILIEVEFPDEETALHFIPPTWFGREVTFDKAYHNSNLSRCAALFDIL